MIGTSSRFRASRTRTGHHGSSSSFIVTSLVIPPPIYGLLNHGRRSSSRTTCSGAALRPASFFSIYTFCISTHLKTGRPQLQKAVKKAWKDLSKKDKKNFKSTPLSQSSQKSTIFSTRWGGWLAWLKKPAQRKFFVTIKFLEIDDNRHESYRFTTKQEHND